MHITSVSFRNVRSFHELDLDLTTRSNPDQPAPRQNTVIIGENGTGKTTLLRAIAVGLADGGDASGLLAEPTGQLVTEGKPDATIEIGLREVGLGRHDRAVQTETKIKDDRGQDVLAYKRPEPFTKTDLVCGYGVSRANHGEEVGRPYRVVDSAHNLFQYQTELIQTELALRRLNDFLGKKWYLRVMNNIKNALGLDSAAKIDLVKGGGVEISGPQIGNNIPLEGWADGYRQTLAWILDFYSWAMKANRISENGNVVGIVLIDEIEQHLHASMQTTLVSRLSELLPNAQIIATTHSPLVALGVAPDELVVLKRVGSKVVAQESVIDFAGYSVEDMLSDPKLFDSDAYGPVIGEKLREYRALASKPVSKRSRREKEYFKALATELASHEIPGFRRNPTLDELRKILKKHNL